MGGADGDSERHVGLIGDGAVARALAGALLCDREHCCRVSGRRARSSPAAALAQRPARVVEVVEAAGQDAVEERLG